MKLKGKFVSMLIKTDDSVIMILSSFVNLGCVYMKWIHKLMHSPKNNYI